MAVMTPAETKKNSVQEAQTLQNVACPEDAPPLENGDRLSRAEFEHRYAEHPEIKRAELIERVVYVSSPVNRLHTLIHARVMLWLGTYVNATPAIEMGDNGSIRLDQDNLVQPDVFLYLPVADQAPPENRPDDLWEGIPDVVVEVAASSAAYDLHDKLVVYRRNRVREYIVFLVYERETRWFVWQEGEYTRLLPDDQGILRSRIYPGLWLDVKRFWANDRVGVAEIARRGLESEEYQQFAARLGEAASNSASADTPLT